MEGFAIDEEDETVSHQSTLLANFQFWHLFYKNIVCVSDEVNCQSSHDFGGFALILENDSHKLNERYVVELCLLIILNFFELDHW